MMNHSFAARPESNSLRRIQAKSRKIAWNIVRYLLVFGIAFIILYPLLVKLSVSLMSEADLLDPTVKWIPRQVTLENYKVVIEALHIRASLFNSLFYTIGITILQLLTCTMAAYGLARYPYPGSRILFMLLVFTLVIPPQTYMSALYVQFRFWDPFGLITLIKGSPGVTNTLTPFVLQALLCQGLRNGLYIFLMRQYFRNLPSELEEAANVDGAGIGKIFFRIILPNSVPILVTVSVLSVVWQWNDSYNNAMLASQMDFLSTNVGNIASLLREGTQSADHLAGNSARLSACNNAAAMLMSLPIVLFFAAVQKSFSENLARTGIVG